eukprot:362917-Chlamydomonas_euryale.AAC.5
MATVMASVAYAVVAGMGWATADVATAAAAATAAVATAGIAAAMAKPMTQTVATAMARTPAAETEMAWATGTAPVMLIEHSAIPADRGNCVGSAVQHISSPAAVHTCGYAGTHPKDSKSANRWYQRAASAPMGGKHVDGRQACRRVEGLGSGGGTGTKRGRRKGSLNKPKLTWPGCGAKAQSKAQGHGQDHGLGQGLFLKSLSIRPPGFVGHG